MSIPGVARPVPVLEPGRCWRLVNVTDGRQWWVQTRFAADPEPVPRGWRPAPADPSEVAALLAAEPVPHPRHAWDPDPVGDWQRAAACAAVGWGWHMQRLYGGAAGDPAGWRVRITSPGGETWQTAWVLRGGSAELIGETQPGHWAAG